MPAFDNRVGRDRGRGTGEGRVAELHDSRTQRAIRGATITRNGTPDNPAVIVQLDDGGTVLKLVSEPRRF
ncbi:MAG: DUF2945 domain-containing protein [Pseudooceanicola sp.]|nr:DUF2945 domain-containing protein [Pseudooceanicola sp.]